MTLSCILFTKDFFFPSMFWMLLLYTFSLTRSLFLIVISKKFQLDLSMVWAWELNVILHLDIFVHYDEQVRESHLILCYVPSYTSYQDSLGTLTIGSHSCLTLTFSCPNFYHINLPATRWDTKGLEELDKVRLNPYVTVWLTLFFRVRLCIFQWKPSF